MFTQARRVCHCVSILPAGGAGAEAAAALEPLARGVQLEGAPLWWHGARQGLYQDDDVEYDDVGAPVAPSGGLPPSLDLTVSFECSPADEPAAVERLLEALRGVEGVEDAQSLLSAPCLVPLRCIDLPDLLLPAEGAGGAGRAGEVDVEGAMELLEEVGIAVITGAITDITEVARAASARIAAADAALERMGPARPTGEFSFKEMSSRTGQRFDLLFNEGDPASAPVFSLATSAPWVGVVERVLGAPCEELICAVSVVYSRPGAPAQVGCIPAQDWHSDGPHRGKLASWEGVGQASPYAMCAFVPLILYDYRLMHRGMPNRSEGTERAVLQFLYHLPDYVEARNYGSASIFDAEGKGV